MFIVLQDEFDSRCNLLVLLGHPDPELLFLSYDAASASLVVVKQMSLFERGYPISEFLTDLLVHPSGEFAIAHAYNGKLRLITLAQGSFEAERDIS